jgi:hypothetical protein
MKAGRENTYMTEVCPPKKGKCLFPKLGCLEGQPTNKGNNKLPNSEQSSKGKVKTHKYINRKKSVHNENSENRNDPDLVQAIWRIKLH